MNHVERFPRLSGWFVFLTGCGSLGGVDYAVRLRGREITGNGLPDLVWFGVPLVLGLSSALLIWQGAKKLNSRWIGVLEMIVHVCAGIVVYLAAAFFYVLGSGIDSL